MKVGGCHIKCLELNKNTSSTQNQSSFPVKNQKRRRRSKELEYLNSKGGKSSRVMRYIIPSHKKCLLGSIFKCEPCMQGCINIDLYDHNTSAIVPNFSVPILPSGQRTRHVGVQTQNFRQWLSQRVMASDTQNMQQLYVVSKDMRSRKM